MRKNNSNYFLKCVTNDIFEALIDEMVRFIDEDGNEQLSGKELERKLSGRILEVLHGI